MEDKIFFYSKSAAKPAGKGTNEYVAHPNEYTELNSFVDWRKVLSNFYVSPFTWDGHRWNSVEHAFQSRKIAIVDPEKALWFTLDSGHEIGLGNGEIARRHRKLVLLDKDRLQEWDVIKSGILESILYAKFSQVELARRILLATCDAVLLHGTRGVPVTRQVELESVRRQIRQLK